MSLCLQGLQQAAVHCVREPATGSRREALAEGSLGIGCMQDAKTIARNGHFIQSRRLQVYKRLGIFEVSGLTRIVAFRVCMSACDIAEILGAWGRSFGIFLPCSRGKLQVFFTPVWDPEFMRPKIDTKLASPKTYSID